MIRLLQGLLAIALVVGAWTPLRAAPGAQKVQAVEVELVAERTSAEPGKPIRLGLRLRHDAGWHTYWRNPGDSGLPTQLALQLPAGWSAGPLQWPAPVRLPVGPLLNFGYDGEIVLPVTLAVPADAAIGDARISGRAQWLVCREVCIPGEAELETVLRVSRDGGSPSPWASLFASSDARTPAETTTLAASITGARLSMLAEGASFSSAQFFPYREGLIDNPGVQSLYAVDGGRRLDVPLASDAKPQALATLFSEPAGVLVLDGRPLEARLREAVVPSAGKLIGATPAPSAVLPSAQPGARGRFGDLLSGSGIFGVGSPGASRADATTGGSATGGSATGGNAAGPSATGGSTTSGSAASGSAAAPASAGTASLAVALLLGVLGGLVLNLMPCVFPVIGLKVLGFAAHDATQGRDSVRHARLHAVTFSAGVIVSFWILAGVLLGLRAAGESAGWGFQLQSPAFVAAMALLFVAIGLNLSGVFEVGASLTRLGGLDAVAAASARRARPGLAGSFGSGALAVLVATPCTAPFMGSALGYTVSQPPLQSLAVFSAIGVGMALPYALLGSFPAWMRWLPKPGRWMQSLREFLAFPMYGTAAWLAWVLGQQSGIDAVLSLTIAAVLVGFAAWLVGRFVQTRARPSLTAAGFATLAIAAAAWLAWPEPHVPAAASASAARDGWQPWSEAAVEAAVSQGRPVLVDFTAAWCVSCQVNKKLVLDRPTVAGELQRRGVVKLRADWTNRDPAITAALERHGRSGVPLYLLYLPGEPAPRVLPEILTAGLVVEALGSAPLAQVR